ncbi:unnamed protein product [Didymodactylos carnosus]|uniref:Uncharacterized protein n=1 Tax=Didymodactylos carnosus TaxID=1234261 RepID=A0A814IG30_9BILA|nr:unnamed protein product [Didymodactylos carnosus]CAF3794234.1 unnamed protein product [Didymodactylos carnosus]
MSNDALKSFCSSYMECIEEISIKNGRHIKNYKNDQLYNDIMKNKDIFQLAINPQLASAAIYNQYEGELQEKRIDLYEKAIEKMVDRLITPFINFPTNYLSKEFGLNTVMVWSIMQELAEYLHSKTEGLTEDILRDIIRKCLVDFQKQLSKSTEMNIEILISMLVDIFKIQAGLLNEFGHNSFRFILRTFQEYLAAKSIIYFCGVERMKDEIYENIKNKIAIPNWRVPLSMTFGISNKSARYSELFNNIITSLLKDEQTLSNAQYSTSLIPYVIIDSLNDMFFLSTDTEYDLIRRLGERLLSDYKNISGFSRLKEHQQLTESYFSKLEKGYNNLIADWFIEKIDDNKNIAPSANIIYHLKWYKPTFHEIFLKNLHNDSIVWNWPIDWILRFYSSTVEDESVLKQLILKNEIKNKSDIIKYITEKNTDWLSLIVTLYGGYKNYNIQNSISQYFKIVQLLGLSDNQRAPFLYYYREVWGRDDPAHSMAVDIVSQLILWRTSRTIQCYVFE